jgi:hypothetical protein
MRYRAGDWTTVQWRYRDGLIKLAEASLRASRLAGLLDNSDSRERGHEHHLDHYNRLHCGHCC